MSHRVPSQDEVIGWFDEYSNWGRWGEDDRLGTANHLTPERQVAAAALIVEGVTVSCAWDISTARAVDQTAGAPDRFMLATGDASGAPGGPRWGGAAEYVGLAYHGYSVTHLDGLSHYFWDGKMYGGRSATSVSVGSGARELPITDLPDGLTGRGVLLDVARHRGVAWLDPGDGVFPAELDAVASASGVQLLPGDIVLIRTGYGARRRAQGPDDVGKLGRAGWHASCIPWLHDHDIAAIGADTAQDVHPSGYPDIRSPVHAVGIVAMGLWLIDNCDLEALSARCEALDRWVFHLSVSPLRFEGGTGSPVNPLASF